LKVQIGGGIINAGRKLGKLEKERKFNNILYGASEVVGHYSAGAFPFESFVAGKQDSRIIHLRLWGQRQPSRRVKELASITITILLDPLGSTMVTRPEIIGSASTPFDCLHL